MTALDVILMVCLLCGAVIGFKQGFIWQVVNVIGLFVGFATAKYLSEYVAEHYLTGIISSPAMAWSVAFGLIWLVVLGIFALIASLLGQVVNAVALGPVNRMGGAVLGILKFVFILGIILNITEHFDTRERIISKKRKEDSVLYKPLKQISGTLFFFGKELKEHIYTKPKDEDHTRTV